jgi:hypothetical protein
MYKIIRVEDVEEHVRQRVDEYSCALLKGRSTLTWFDSYANFPPSTLFSCVYSHRDGSIRFTFGFPVMYLAVLQDSRHGICFTAELERSEGRIRAMTRYVIVKHRIYPWHGQCSLAWVLISLGAH